MSLIVQKYGGTSVGNTDKILNVAKRIKTFVDDGHKVIVVVSARSGVTNDLIARAKTLNAMPDEREMDMLLAVGEQETIALTAMALHSLGVKAVSRTGAQAGIHTDFAHTRARIVEITGGDIKKCLDEGKVVIVAGFQGVDGDGNVLFANAVAEKMLGGQEKSEIIGKNLTSLIAGKELNALLDGDGKEVNVRIKIGDKEALADRVPVRPDGEAAKIIILRDRAEYTRLMEELAGTRYLVDSMRANNHDFTNKLHVIMGLIQMGMYDKATDYIQNITMVQREAISKIMNAINEPSMAALLIGKAARASELNVKFALKEGSYFNKSDLWIPTETFITITGNLIQNAFDSLNAKSDDNKQVFVGLYSKPDAVLITVEDSGDGMKQEIIEHIFENGFSTKGEGRGTGLYRVKSLSDEFGGKITVESTVGVGTTVAVSFFRQ